MSQFGDVIPSPGFTRYDATPGQPDILYSQSGAEFHGGTMAPGNGVLRYGTALKFDEATKQYSAASAASEVVGFLRYSVDTGSSAEAPLRQGLFVMGGVLKADQLQMPSGTDVADKAGLATALGGHYDASRERLRF